MAERGGFQENPEQKKKKRKKKKMKMFT